MYKNFLRIVISGRASNVIFRHLSNVILGFIPRIHAKHSSLDTRDTPEYDHGKRMCFVSENDNLVAQCGRSMIEMLGVLAIIGVLSVGGIAGYSKAMMKFKINKTLQQISEIVTNVRTLYINQKDLEDLDSRSAIEMGIVPDNLDIDSSGNITDVFGGGIEIRRYHLNADYFEIEFHSLPPEACIELATADWGKNESAGVLGLVVAENGSVSFELVENIDRGCSGEKNESYFYSACSDVLPISPAKVANLCKNNADLAISFSK